MLAFLLVITVSFCPVLDVRADDNSDMMRSSAGENIKMEYDYATQTFTVLSSDERQMEENSGRSSNYSKTSAEYVPDTLSSIPPSDISVAADFGDWHTVSDATAGRYRNTVRILARGEDGGIGYGTGFMIGPAAVATAAHCIYGEDFGDDCIPTSITVIPAPYYETNPSNPSISATATGFIVNSKWTNDFDFEYDWAIIKLNANIGNNVGWLGLRYQESSYNNTAIRVQGYPFSINGVFNTTMYYTDGTITSSQTKTLKSNNTCTAGGMSGGPVYFYLSGYGYTAIALLQGAAPASSPTHNVFTRITEDLYNDFVSYRDYSV